MDVSDKTTKHSEKGSVINNHYSVVVKKQKKSRPLPELPPEAQKNVVQHRDVGVMTPASMDADVKRTTENVYFPTNPPPQTLGPGLKNHSGKVNITSFLRKWQLL